MATGKTDDKRGQKVDKMKIGLITSRGGHLYQVYQLKSWWGKYDRFWITFRGKDVGSMLRGERIYYAYYPESRNIVNAIKNLLIGIKVICKEKPDLLFSDGAGICPPVFLVGKLLGCRLVYIEPYDFIDRPSLSGRMVYCLVDLFLIQHEEQKKFFPKGVFKGAVI